MKHGATNEASKWQAPAAPIVIIGYGNSYRRDDGAGAELAARLVQYWSRHGVDATLLTDTQLLPEMAAEIASDEVQALFFVDCEMSDDSTDIQICPLAVDSTSPSTGHQLDPATLLVYAALLYGRTPRAWLVTIPGTDFDHGQGFSEKVKQLLSDVSTLADQLLKEMKDGEMKDGESCTNLQLPNV